MVVAAACLLLLTQCPTAAFAPGAGGPGHVVTWRASPSAGRVHAGAWRLRMQVSGAGRRSVLSKAFKKPTGALTVSLEYERSPASKYSENDLIVLSMQVAKASLCVPAIACTRAHREQLGMTGLVPHS